MLVEGILRAVSGSSERWRFSSLSSFFNATCTLVVSKSPQRLPTNPSYSNMASDLPKDFADELEALSLNSSSPFTWRLLGTYSWIRHSEICVPGYPPVLSEHYNTRVLAYEDLASGTATKEDVHIGEYFHSHYFEPIEAALRHCQPDLKLTDFNLITDRNNIRKLDEVLSGPKERFERYSAFILKARRYGKLLVLKREELESNTPGTAQGQDFEKKLTEQPYVSESTHALVEIVMGTGKSQMRILVRCEVDACHRTTKTLTTKDYGFPSEKSSDSGFYSPYEVTSTGLVVKKPRELKTVPEIRLQDLVEIKMGSKMEDAFQSHMVGVNSIVHGLKYYARSERCTHSLSSNRNTCRTGMVKTKEYNDRLLRALKKAFDLANGMKGDTTYLISRETDSNELKIAEIEDKREWFAAPPSPDSTLQ